jgi:flavin-binding protein dodecin
MHDGLKRATQTLKNVTSAWIASQEVLLKGNKVAEYRVRMKVTFILK